jgi:hypothetical protein
MISEGDAASLDGLTRVVEGLRHFVDEPERHSGIDFARQFDEPGGGRKAKIAGSSRAGE